MATDTVEWVLKLVDRVSGPAAGIVRSLESIGVTGKALGSAATFGVDALTSALHVLTTAAKISAVAVTGLIVAGAKMALDAASFKDDMLRSFELMLGSRQAATDTYAAIEAIADKAPFKTNEVMGVFKTLLAGGFKQNEAENIFAAISDVAAVQGDEGAQKLKDLTAIISKINAMGKLGGEELERLSVAGGAAGAGSKQLLQQLATSRGTSVDAVRQAISEGQIKSTEAIAAIMDTVRANTDKGGPLGQATLLFGQSSLGGAMSTFKSRVDQLFQDVDIGPVKDLLGFINTSLAKGSVAGDALRATFNELFGGVLAGGSDLIRQAFTPENIQRFGAALHDAYVFARDFVVSIRAGWQTMQPALSALGEQLARTFGTTGQASGAAFAGVLVQIATAVVTVSTNVLGFIEIMTPLIRVMFRIQEAFWLFLGTLYTLGATIATVVLASLGDLYGAMTGTGTRLVDGLWQGIKGAWSGLLAGFKDLAMQLPEGVKKVLGIASPSRVMMQLGMYTAEGFGRGLESGAERFDAAPVLSIASLSASGSSGSRGGSEGAAPSFTINIDARGTGMDERRADDLAARIRREVESLFDGTGIQIGAT